MAHGVRINGTAYGISGGKTLINGTAYGISGGKTRIGGTAYSISFAGVLVPVHVSLTYPADENTRSYLEYSDGSRTRQVSSAAELLLAPGTVVSVWGKRLSNNIMNRSYIRVKLNGEVVGDRTETTNVFERIYDYTVPDDADLADVNIELYNGTALGYGRTDYITINENR